MASFRPAAQGVALRITQAGSQAALRVCLIGKSPIPAKCVMLAQRAPRASCWHREPRVRHVGTESPACVMSSESPRVCHVGTESPACVVLAQRAPRVSCWHREPRVCHVGTESPACVMLAQRAPRASCHQKAPASFWRTLQYSAYACVESSVCVCVCVVLHTAAERVG